MTSTRQLILDYLDGKQSGTAPEIARAINLTAANVRHHLSILLKEGVIEAVGEHHTRQRGRPSLRYALSAHIHQHNLDQLTGVLLAELLSDLHAQEKTRALKLIAHRLADDQSIPENLSQRLFQAVQRLKDMHYDAHWEAHAEAPNIIFGFCPYAGILAEHPELCEMDAHLIEALLGRPAQLVDKMAKDDRGSTYCRFIIQKT